MARLSKVILVAALVAMLTMAPVLEARPLTADDSSDSVQAVALTHQRQLRIFGLIGFKLCIVKTILSFGLWGCPPRPVVVVQPPPVIVKPEEPKKYTPPPPEYRRKQA